MTVHLSRVKKILTPQFLASEIQEIIKVVEKYPDPKEIAVGDLTVEQFREIQLTFHGSKKILKEFTEMYVGRFLRMYCQQNRITNPTVMFELLEGTNDLEFQAIDILYDRLKKLRGLVPAEEVAKLDEIAAGIQARNKVRLEEMGKN